MAMMESKWYVDACYDKGFRAPHYGRAIDDWSEVEGFIWEYVQKGFHCLIIEHETGRKWYALADDFNENIVEPKEIIKDWRWE